MNNVHGTYTLTHTHKHKAALYGLYSFGRRELRKLRAELPE